jgi:hypothetical protein
LFNLIFISLFILLFAVLILISGCSLSSTYIRSDFVKPFIKNVDKEELSRRILLIGDAGQQAAEVREPVLDALEMQASLIPDKTTILFLGDNIYPYGLDEPDHRLRAISERRLMEQILVVENANVKGIFIPGNHDWDKGRKNGWKRILLQQQFIEEKGSDNLMMLPGDGCPGPSLIDYDKLRLVIIDSQWWLHKHEKPTEENRGGCVFASESEILNAVENALQTAGDKFVLIAAHHPLDTHGPHGGHFNWKDHLFPLLNLNPYLWIPLPVVGSLYPLFRLLGITRQDITNPTYKYYINNFKSILSKYKNLAFASGHEHSLQILEGASGNFYLISGFGTSTHDSNITTDVNTVYADDEQGFIQVDILKDGRARCSVFQVEEESGSWSEIFTMWLNEK